MAYLIAAIVMTWSVLEGHSPIASLFKCSIVYLLRVMWSLCNCSAELLVMSYFGPEIDLKNLKYRTLCLKKTS